MQIRIAYRRGRVFWRQLIGSEPVLARKRRIALEFHGSDYGGWPIVSNSLSNDSVVIDIGLGEDISFSESLLRYLWIRPDAKIDRLRTQTPGFWISSI
jgi:hypothetical protein